MRYLLPKTPKPMFENQDKNRKDEGNAKHVPEGSPNSWTGPPNEQDLNKKRYAVKLIEKRTGLLILAASLMFILVSVYFISQKNLYVYRDVWQVLAFSKNVDAFEFDSYKTIQNSVGFELLSDKFKRKKGFYGIQYNPKKRHLTVYANDSVVTEKSIRKILHTKAKSAVGYPDDSSKHLFRYRLTIENYYDSFDGLILKNKLQSMKGVYYIESTFKNDLYVDIFGNKGLNIDSLKARIENPTVVMPLKKKLTEVSTDYAVNTVDITNADSQRGRILNKIFIKDDFESSTPISDSRRLDTLKLAMKKFPFGRKLTFSSFRNDIEIERFHIQSIKATNTRGPELEIVFESKRPSDKEKLFLLLNRPSFTHMSKGKKKAVENPYVFAKKN